MHLKELQTISHHDLFDNFSILTTVSFKSRKNHKKYHKTERNLKKILDSSKKTSSEKRFKKEEFIKLRNKYQKKILENMPFHLKLDIDNKENINPNIGYFKTLDRKRKKSHRKFETMARLLHNQKSKKSIRSKDDDFSSFLLKKRTPSLSICSMFKSEKISNKANQNLNVINENFHILKPMNRSLGKRSVSRERKSLVRKRSGVGILRKYGRDKRDRSYSLVPSKLSKSKFRSSNMRESSSVNRRQNNISIGRRKSSKSFGRRLCHFSSRDYHQGGRNEFDRLNKRRKIPKNNQHLRKRNTSGGSKIDHFARKLQHLKKSNSIKAGPLLRRNRNNHRTFSRSKIEESFERVSKPKKRPKTQRILKSYSQIMRDSSKNLLKRINSRITPKPNTKEENLTTAVSFKDIQFSRSKDKPKLKNERKGDVFRTKDIKESALDPSLKRLALVIGAQKKLNSKAQDKDKSDLGYMSGRFSSLGTLGNCLRRIRGDGRLGSYMRKKIKNNSRRGCTAFGQSDKGFHSIYSLAGS